MTLHNAFGELAQEHASSHGDAHLVAGSKLKWRREFNNPNATFWDTTVTTAGINISDPVNGTIVVPMGTTVNAESALVSKQIFNIPLKVAVCAQWSQKIANNEVYFELVGCDEAGVLDETRVAAWRIAGSDSTSATVSRYETRNGAAARRQSANVTVVTHTTAAAIFEITAESDEVWFSSKGVDSSSARSVAGVMNLVAPDPEGLYKVRLRFKNGAVAPASNTNVTLNFALAVDYTEIQTEVTGGNGNGTGGQSVPVNVVSGTVSANIAANASAAGTSIAKILSAATTNATNVKTTAARLYGYHLANLTAAWKYVRLYNKTSAPTVGTDSPVMVIPIPPNDTVTISFPAPVTFASGLGYSITNGVADLDNTAVAANDVVGHLLWL